MKKKYFYTLAVVLVLVSAFLMERTFDKSREWKALRDVIPVDTAVTALPDDMTRAKQILNAKKKALMRLSPDRPYIVIDTYGNRLFLRTRDSVLLDADCSTGTGSELYDSTSGRHWLFYTPHGVFKVDSKLAEPWWRKPDWAYIEENESPPTKESERFDPKMLGAYAIGFGDGYFIHGTVYERLLGINVTHGCVRLGYADLKKLYQGVALGTPVYIF
jgi:hypothetical protein